MVGVDETDGPPVCLYSMSSYLSDISTEEIKSRISVCSVPRSDGLVAVDAASFSFLRDGFFVLQSSDQTVRPVLKRIIRQVQSNGWIHLSALPSEETFLYLNTSSDEGRMTFYPGQSYPPNISLRVEIDDLIRLYDVSGRVPDVSAPFFSVDDDLLAWTRMSSSPVFLSDSADDLRPYLIGREEGRVDFSEMTEELERSVIVYGPDPARFYFCSSLNDWNFSVDAGDLLNLIQFLYVDRSQRWMES